MIITKISKSRFKKGFYSVVFDGKQYVSLPAISIVKLGFKEGNEYEQDELDSLLKSEEKNIAMDTALRMISLRQRSKKEIETRLKQKKHSTGSVEEVTSRLNELGYINDRKFAENRANYRKNQFKGPEFIKNELEQKGISGEIIREVMDGLYSSKEEEIEYIKKCAVKKLNLIKDKENSSSKLINYLAGRGFSIDKIFQALKEVKNEVF